MSKNIILCFDGTCNDPGDAEAGRNWLGQVKDHSISNIFKLHLLFGGGVKGEQILAPQQKTFYYSGVGTYGGMVRRVFNALVAPENEDVGAILDRAGKDLRNNYEKNDQVHLFGFSRGAALARRFAAVAGQYVADLKEKGSIRFLGVFDTVASIGLPNLNRYDQPRSDVVFENNQVASAVREALHILALDEKRLAFRPTLMHAEERVTEVWFPGAHSDVGGGFLKDGLSDVALTFMLGEIRKRRLGLVTRSPEGINYQGIDTPDVKIDYEDLIIEPDPLAESHQERRPPLISRGTLGDRRCVQEGGDNFPILHQSVGERICGTLDYRPASLRGVQHQVIDSSGVVNPGPFNGLRSYLQGNCLLPGLLAKGASKRVIVHAHMKLNRTLVLVQQGKKYRFTIGVDQYWQDGELTCGPYGWRRGDPDVQLGLREVMIAVMEPLRRLPAADWFEVVGMVGKEGGESVRPLQFQTVDWVPATSGELLLFANDLEHFYGNNMGCIDVTITAV